jgi:hypothetical protein
MISEHNVEYCLCLMPNCLGRWARKSNSVQWVNSRLHCEHLLSLQIIYIIVYNVLNITRVTWSKWPCLIFSTMNAIIKAQAFRTVSERHRRSPHSSVQSINVSATKFHNLAKIDCLKLLGCWKSFEIGYAERRVLFFLYRDHPIFWNVLW